MELLLLVIVIFYIAGGGIDGATYRAMRRIEDERLIRDRKEKEKEELEKERNEHAASVVSAGDLSLFWGEVKHIAMRLSLSFIGLYIALFSFAQAKIQGFLDSKGFIEMALSLVLFWLTLALPYQTFVWIKEYVIVYFRARSLAKKQSSGDHNI